MGTSTDVTRPLCRNVSRHFSRCRVDRQYNDPAIRIPTFNGITRFFARSALFAAPMTVRHGVHEAGQFVCSARASDNECRAAAALASLRPSGVADLLCAVAMRTFSVETEPPSICALTIGKSGSPILASLGAPQLRRSSPRWLVVAPTRGRFPEHIPIDGARLRATFGLPRGTQTPDRLGRKRRGRCDWRDAAA
jgi:hypothetical protein